MSGRRAFLILGVWTWIVSLLCNIDSYLYAQCGQYDSAWFFMCGKAMMNGMTPYADFADSKGILLWLIYGIGYLIDNYSYVGVFWLAWLNLWLVLSISFRTARLWLSDGASLIAAMMLAVPLTYWNFYIETKAEHFCWPWVAWGIHVLMKGFIGQESKPRDYALVGAAVIACLFLKWSIAVMMLSLVCSIGWWAWRRDDLGRYLKWFAVGLSAAFLPIAIYFTVVGIWADVWREYFCNTLSSVSMPLAETLTAYAGEWRDLITSRRILYLVYTLPVFVLWRRRDWFATALPMLCGLTFVAISIRHDFAHYVSIAGPFAILTIVVVIRWVIGHKMRLRYVAAVLLLAQGYVVWGSIHYSHTFCTKAGAKFDHFMAVSAAMSRVSEHPTIIHIGMETGLCMGSALPGTRYWTTQHGRTEEMWAQQLEGIRAGKADFVRCADGAPDYIKKILADAGYVYWTDNIFARVPMDGALAIKHLTAWDIVTKKTYKEIYGE